jgi:hypothetical protein
MIDDTREILSHIQIASDVIVWRDEGRARARAFALASVAFDDASYVIGTLATCARIVGDRGGSQVAGDLLEIARALLPYVGERTRVRKHKRQLRKVHAATRAIGGSLPRGPMLRARRRVVRAVCAAT